MKLVNKKISAKKSSAAWVRRQLSDPYVERAHRDGWRSRAVYKLSEIDEKFHIFRGGQVIADLGAAPGSWSEWLRKNFPKSRIIAIDLLPIKPIDGVEFYHGDFTSDAALEWIEKTIRGASPHDGGARLDVVLSDMAPNTTGHQKTDHIRQTALLEHAFEFARKNLKPGGSFVAKSFAGGASAELVSEIKKHFRTVRHVKPDASRKDSVEMFIVATDRIDN